MKASLLRQGLASVALVLFAAGHACAGPLISGSVLVTAGERPEAVVVELFPILPDFEFGRLRLQGVERFEPAASGRLTGEGRFHLEAPQSGLYRLVVRTPGGVPVQVGPIALVEDLELAPVAPPRDVGVHLEVIDTGGLPIAGAWGFASGEESLENGWRLDFRLGRTDADGRLTLPRRPGEKLSLSFFVPSRGEVRLDAFEGGRVHMPPIGTPRLLRVVYEDGAPLPGILLRYGARAWPVGLSDANGVLRLPPATGKPEELRLVAPAGLQHSFPAPTNGLEAGELTVRLPAARTLLGRIVDARTGRPIAGALAWNDQDHGAFAATDANGRYSLAAPAAEGGAIEVVAAGYLKARVEVSPAQARLGRSPSLGLERAASLTGIVVGSGRPISGAIVEAVYNAARGEREFDPSARLADRASTDAQGRFRLRRLESGQRYELRARREGYFPTATETTALDPPAPGGPVRLELAPIRALAGRVKDSQGHALGGVEIDLRPAIRAGRTPPALQSINLKETIDAPPRTDAQGRFLLTVPPAAAVDAVFRKSGFAPFSLRRVRIPPGDGPFDLRGIVLRPGVALRGRVINAAGKPVVEAEVFLLEEEPRPSQDPPVANRPMAETSRAGEFAFRDLPTAVPLHLYVRARGYQATLLRGVRPPSKQPLTITLEPGLSLAGWVVDEAGNPIARAVVEAIWQPILPGDPQRRPTGMPVSFYAKTARSGRFEIEGMPRGPITLAAEARGFIGEEHQDLEVPLPEGSADVEIVLKRGALLTGHITTTEGEPVPGVHVLVGDAGGVSDQEGQYLVEGAPPGLQRVSVFHPDYPRLETTHRLGPELNTLDLQLEAGVEVSGRVVEEQGRPVPGARITLRSADRQEYKAFSASDGGFVFQTVARSRYRLGADREGYATSAAPREIMVGREPVTGLEVTLRKGATITGLILGLKPDELSGVTVEATLAHSHTLHAEVDAEGRYRLANLEMGDWTIRASLWSGERQVTVRQPILPDDRVVERDLEFRQRLKLTGRVLVGEEPLPNATISLRGHQFSSERSRLSGFDGGFRLDDLEPDTYELGVSHAERLLAHNEILELATDREIEIRLQPTTVRGRVIAASSGMPLPEARVSLHHLPTPEAPEFMITGFAGPDGRFTLPQVGPGTYQLEAAADGHASLEQPVVIDAGKEPPEIEVRLERALGLELDVRLADGSPPPAVHLLARDVAGRIGATATLPVDQTGRTKLSTLAEGRWTLLISAENAATAAIEVQVPGPTVALTLPPAGRLHVRIPSLLMSGRSASLRLFSPTGQPLWTLEPGGSLRSEWVLFAGQATITGLPEGPCTVDVESSEGRRWHGLSAVVATQETAMILE
jgi:carboxypeptidase family protein